jgi:PTH1 family peptidyl-tRNA hydrolase
MKLVVGLGNPGLKYTKTRHNFGFRVIEELARRYDAGQGKLAHGAEIAEVLVGSEKTLLVAPQEYMNLSGRAVRSIVDYFKLPLDDLLIICDDLNLETGRLRMRPAGSDGGQKGLRDTINRLGTQEFARLRCGIGRPPGQMDSAAYVLGRFRSNELDAIELAVQLAADGAEIWVRDGLDAAMNKVNAPAAD